MAPCNHGITIRKGIETTHGTSIYTLRVVIFLHNAHSHLSFINLEMEAPGTTVALTTTCVLTMIVKHGDLRFVLVETGMMLPAEVGCVAFTKILELIARAAAENPDWVSVCTVDESQET
jgi:hypothetical protein